MRFRTTLVLAVLAATLAAAYVVLDVLPRTRVTGTAERIAQGSAVFAGAPFSRGRGAERATLRTLITRLKLDRGDETIVLERVAPRPDERWRITQPITAEASPGDVGLICYALEAITRERVIEPAPGESLDLAQYGLHAPTVSVSFTLVDAPDTTHTLHIGDMDPTNRVRYVKRADADAVFGVPAKYLLPLGRPLAALRDRRLVTLDPADVRRITLRRGDRPGVVLERHGERWRLVEPYAAGVDDLRIEQVLVALKEQRIETGDFVADAPESPAPYGLDDPAARIGVAAGEREQVLLIGRADRGSGKVFAMREGVPSVFKLTAATVDALTPALRALHVGRALDFGWEDARSLRLDLPGETVVLERDAENWCLRKPVERDADDVQVREFLKRTASLEIKHWLAADDLKRLGLDPPVAHLAVGLKDGGTRELSIGRPVPEQRAFYARTGKAGPVVTLDAEFLGELQAGHLRFISRRIVAFPEEKARRLIIERGGVTFELEKGEGGWVLNRPAHVAADPEAVRKLLWKVSFISAVRYVERDPADWARYGLAEPSLKLAVAYEKGSGERERIETEVLFFGKAESDQTVFARRATGDVVFTVHGDLIDALQTQPASRTVCALPGARVTSVGFKPADGPARRFEREGGRWAEDDDLNRRVALLVAIACTLKAEDIVAWTRARDEAFGLAEPRAVVTLYLGAMGVELKVGAEAPEGGAYLASGAPMVYRVADNIARVLLLQRPTVTGEVE